MSTLRERWFEDPLDEEQEAVAQINQRWADQKNFIGNKYLNEEFIPRLEAALLQHEPKPGTHEEMLHTTGVRAGLLLVKGWLDQVKRNVKELEKNA